MLNYGWILIISGLLLCSAQAPAAYPSDRPRDMAIIVNFPEEPIAIPHYRSFWNSAGHLIDFNRDGFLMVGHTGVILVNGINGSLQYFDLGRYDDRHDLMGPRPDFYGVVRSKRNVPELKLDIVARIENGWITNLEEILVHLGLTPLLRKYGRLDAAVVYQLDLKKMVKKAIDFEERGFLFYGAPAHIYCTSFVRKVIRAGGQGFRASVYTGTQTLQHIRKRHPQLKE